MAEHFRHVNVGSFCTASSRVVYRSRFLPFCGFLWLLSLGASRAVVSVDVRCPSQWRVQPPIPEPMSAPRASVSSLLGCAQTCCDTFVLIPFSARTCSCAVHPVLGGFLGVLSPGLCVAGGVRRERDGAGQ